MRGYAQPPFSSVKTLRETMSVKDDPESRQRITAGCRQRQTGSDNCQVCALHWFAGDFLCRFMLISCVVFIAAVILKPAGASAETIDRLMAAVNGKAITEGELKLARSLNEILMLGTVRAKLSDKDEIQRMIDLELLRQELESFSDLTAAEEEVEGRMEELRKSYAKEGGLTAILERLGLQESELRAYLSLQISILQLIDFRFRPFVSIPEEEIQQYYSTKYAPQIGASGAIVPGLEEVSSKIVRILTEEKVNASLDRWLQDSRRRAQIEYFGGNESEPEGAKK